MLGQRTKYLYISTDIFGTFFACNDTKLLQEEVTQKDKTFLRNSGDVTPVTPLIFVQLQGGDTGDQDNRTFKGVFFSHVLL